MLSERNCFSVPHCSLFRALSKILCRLEIHLKATETFIPDIEVSESYLQWFSHAGSMWLSLAIHTPSKSCFLDWFYMMPSVWINQIPTSGRKWCLSTDTVSVTLLQWAGLEQFCGPTIQETLVSSLFSNMLSYWPSPKLSVAHCSADVGCNTSWIIFFHSNKNAAAVNRHPITTVGSYWNGKQSCRRLDCPSYLV